MPRKAKEILKARGYTDAELEGLVLLQDARFTKALEDEDAEREALANANTKMKADLDATTKWYHEEAVPALDKLTKDMVKEKSERARLQAQLEAEQEMGLRRVASDQGGQGGSQNQGAQGGGAGGQNGNGNRQAATPDPSLDERFVTRETFQSVVNQYGDAIAMGNDIVEDHRDLFGKRLPGGLGALRANYQKATETGFRGTLRDYWQKEYNVDKRREELSAKEQQDHEAKIRADERAKVTQEMMNPHTRPMEASRNPFVRQRKIEGGVKEGDKQPWEQGTVEQRRSQRVVKFGTKVLQGNQAG